MKHNYKIVASTVLIVVLLSVFFSVSAFADPLSLAIGGAMSAYAEASGISIASSGLTPNSFNSYWHQSTGLGDDWLDPLSDYRVYYHHDSVNNTVDIFTDGAIIPAGKGGVDNWITNNSVTSNSSGTIYSNVQTFEGYPFVGASGQYRYTRPLGSLYIPQSVTVGQEFVFSNGDLYAHYQVASQSGTYFLWNYDIYFRGVLARSGSNTNLTRDLTYYFGLQLYVPTGNVCVFVSTSGVPISNPSSPWIGTISSGYSSMSWTSGDIDTDTGDGLWMVNIPASIFSEISDVEEGFNSDSSIKASILDALNNYAAEYGWLDTPYFGDEPYVPPVPPTPTPYPTDSLGNVPYATWQDDYGEVVTDTLGSIDQNIEDVNDTIGLVGEDIVDSIDTYGQAAVEAIVEQTDVIDTYGQSAIEAIENQTDVIDTIGQTVSDVLESIDTGINDVTSGIRTKIDTLTDALTDSLAEVGENVIEAVKQEVLGDLGKIESGFSAVISRLRSAFSIWHYVVEWIGSIGSVFGWILGAASGTSYYMILPIYACIAGGIVLGVYRRFGR